jgi:hypothetical protein
MRNFKGALQNLVDAGAVRKLKAGYRANEKAQPKGRVTKNEGY